jgi:DNA-binding response OmpR family regulator
MKILIVEDEPVLREVLAEMFSTGDHEVKAVATGASGLAALERWPPDVLVTDLGLPESDGEEVAQAAVVLLPRPWIVLMSAERGRLESARFLADAIVHKPFHMDELMSLIELYHLRFLRGHC